MVYVHDMATAFASRSAATMTARIVVMMTPGEKRALEQRARDFEMTPSEFIRQAGQKFDPTFDDSFFEAAALEVEAGNAAMHDKLNGLVERVDATIKAMDELRAS